MQNIIFGIIMTLLLVPGSVFAASGTVGSVETLGVSVVNIGRTAQMRTSVRTPFPQTRAFFEYGTTPSLGQVTSPRTLAKDKDLVVSLQAHPLTPNTTYYYRAVIEGTGGALRGEMRSFVSNKDQSGASDGVSSESSGVNTTGNTQNGNSGVNTTTNNNSTGGITSNTQIAGVAGASNSSGSSQNQGGSSVSQNTGAGAFFQRLFDAATRSRPLQLSLVMNPEKPKAREIVEYIVTYTNDSNQPIGAGDLNIILPDTVVYLADNSGGKTTLAKVAGGQEIALTTNPLPAKGKGSITVMAVAGSGVASAVPTAVASISYKNAQGAVQNIATNKAAKATPLVAAVAGTNLSSQNAANTSSNSSSGGVLPNTFFEWLIFLMVVTGIIVVVRRILAVYQERKKRILEESRPTGNPAHA